MTNGSNHSTAKQSYELEKHTSKTRTVNKCGPKGAICFAVYILPLGFLCCESNGTEQIIEQSLMSS